MKTRTLPILFALLALIVSSLACSVGGELSLTNARTAFDEDGNQPSTVFSSNSTIYAVADLSNAPLGTVAKSRWFAIDVPGETPNTLIDEAAYTVNEESFTGLLYFSLAPATAWPNGSYAVELYLNDELIETLAYTVE